MIIIPSGQRFRRSGRLRHNIVIFAFGYVLSLVVVQLSCMKSRNYAVDVHSHSRVCITQSVR
jgi:hypothetical protein